MWEGNTYDIEFVKISRLKNHADYFGRGLDKMLTDIVDWGEAGKPAATVCCKEGSEAIGPPVGCFPGCRFGMVFIF